MPPSAQDVREHYGRLDCLACGQQPPSEQDRLFWREVRRALLTLSDAIKDRYLS